MPIHAVADGLKRAVSKAGSTIDFYSGGVILASSLYFLQSHWMHIRYPRMTTELTGLMPLPAWGFCLLLLAIAFFVAEINRADNMLILCYVLAFGFWGMVGWLWCFGVLVPTWEGVMAPATAMLAVIRTSQLSPESRAGTCAD